MGKLKVNGSIEAVGNIVINAANNVDRFLHFDSTDSTGGYDWRIGYLGTGTDNANYLVFQSTGNAGENWTSALRFGLNDLNATFAGNILPSVNNSKTIGSSSYKWNNIYATTFTGNLSGTASSASSAPWSGITSKPDYYPVRQSKSTASNYRPLLMHYVNGGYGADPGTANAQVYYNETIAACPSTGAIAATKFIGALQGNASSASTCNGTALEWSGSIAWADTSWIAAWNADGTKIKALNKSSFAAASHTHSYVPLSGGTMSGRLSVNVTNNTSSPTAQSIVLNGIDGSTDTAKAPGIGFHIGNQNWGSLKFLHDGSFRFYNNGMSGYMPVYASTFYGNLSGNASSASSVPWSGITGKPSSYTPSGHTHSYLVSGGTTSGSSHAEALKTWFTNNKASIPRNGLLNYYSSAYGNGSQYMGYFLSGYDSGPYGGFFVAHYQDPYYIGISAGNFVQQRIVTSTNYSGYAVPLSGGTMSGGLAIVNHTQNNSYDALLFVSHHSTNEWGITIDKAGSYDYGLYINCGQGNYGLSLNGGLLLYSGVGYGTSFPSNPATGRIFFKI